MWETAEIPDCTKFVGTFTLDTTTGKGYIIYPNGSWECSDGRKGCTTGV